MKTFVDAQIKHAPSNVKPRRASRAINPLVTWAVIAFVGFLASIACAVPSFAQIVGTVQLNIERRGHTATLLEDGKVLIVGGDNQSGIVNQVELLDPASQTSSLAAMPIVARTDHTATRLADGRVLIIGGRDQNGALTSTEIYNPLTARFTAGPSLTTPRSGHSATVLANGNILVAGGDASGSAELYNPITQSFSLIAGSMNTARKFQSAILLNNGQVLIAGGVGAQNNVLNTAEVYDPSSQSFYLPPTDMQTPRALATLKLLADSKVQIIGGDAELSMEVFDPTNGIFIAKALLPPNADLLGATLSTQSRAALFSPTISQDSLLQGVLTPEQLALLDRADHSMTELPSRNQVLVAGGINSGGQTLNIATLVSSSTASVTTDKTDYPPGEIVTITGSGFRPNEQVQLSLHEFPEAYADISFSAIANQQGNFVANNFAPQLIDLDRIFTLTAIGQSSGFTAQTAFKDSNLQSVTLAMPTSVTITQGDTAQYTVNVNMGGNTNACTVTLSVTTALPAGAVAQFGLPNPTTATNVNFSRTLSIATNGTTPAGTYPFTVQATRGSDCQGNGNLTTAGTLVVQAPAIAPTTVTAQPATGTYGGTTTLSAKLKKTSDNSAISDKTISFTLNGGNAGTAITDGSGVATLTGVSLSGISAGTYPNAVGASFAGDTGFQASNGTNTLTINKKDATWTTIAASKTYGDPDPVPLTTGSGSGFVPADGVSATYARAAGENASPPTYHITATLSATVAGALNNYNITNAGAEFTINKKDATWTTIASSKTYGDPDPVPLTTGSGSGFVPADGVSATYARAAGENASPPTYHITATLSATVAGALNNYNITNAGAEFTINKKDATWTTIASSKTYGDPDPVPLTTGSGSGFVPADGVSATYARAAGENASPPTYHITATLSATVAGALNNYNITNAGAEFTINKKDATWTTIASSKTYGDPDPVPLTTGSGSGFVPADGVSATYARAAGENASPPTYHITATLSATVAGALNNYNITNAGAEFTINKRPITVTADAKTKTYSESDPALTYQITSGSLKSGDSITGALTRVAGENVGTYAVSQGTLAISDGNSGNNYDLTFIGANLTITTGFAFNGFYSPIGGSFYSPIGGPVENSNGGSYADPVKSFKLGSTIPVKFGAVWLKDGAAVITGVQTLQAVKYSNATDWDPPIDATPTDVATDGNHFRLTGTDWHFNLSTKGSGFSAGTWLLVATLQDGSKHSVWISIKK